MNAIILPPPLGVFGIYRAIERAIAGAKGAIVTYAIWIGVALLGLMFAYTAIQTISARATNAAIDVVVAVLRSPVALVGVLAAVAVVGVGAWALFRSSRSDVALIEGDHIVCEDDPKKVYRYTGGQKRWYPTPEIARSWGSVYKSATNNNHKTIPQSKCNKIPQGPNMLFRR